MPIILFEYQDLQYAMRRAGQNPTDIEVQDMLNKIDDGSGVMDFDDFLLVMREKGKEVDMEIHFKDAFRVFSKDKDGKGKDEEDVLYYLLQAVFLLRSSSLL